MKQLHRCKKFLLRGTKIVALKAKDAHSSEGCDLRHGRRRSMEIALCGMQEYLVDDAIQSNCGVIVAYESICSWTVHGRSALSLMPKCSSIGFVTRMQSTIYVAPSEEATAQLLVTDPTSKSRQRRAGTLLQ